MTLRTEPSDRDVRTHSAASRVDLGTLRNRMCGVACCRKEWGTRDNDNKRYTMRRMERVDTCQYTINRTVLEDATNTKSHGNQRLYVQWWKAPDDGHNSVERHRL
jgi:hypothetical protein